MGQLKKVSLIEGSTLTIYYLPHIGRKRFLRFEDFSTVFLYV